MTDSRPAPPPLTRPLRVLDLTDDLAVGATRVLVGLGADVVRVVDDRDRPEGSARRLHWHVGKRIVTVGESDRRRVVDELATAADAVIESGSLGRLDGVRIDGDEAHSRWPDAVHVVVTPFGLTGPRRNWTGDDLVLAAAGGMVWLGGRPDGPPRQPPREQATQLAGTHAAIAALLGVLAAARDGRGQLIDVSAQAAVAATVETAAISWIHNGRYPSRSGGEYEHVAHRIFAAADGFVAGGYSGSPRMWTDLLAWLQEAGEAGDLGEPQWADATYRWQQRPHVDALVAAFVARRPAAAIAEEARRRSLPWAEVVPPEALLDNPQLRERSFQIEIEAQPGLLPDNGFAFEAARLPRPVRLREPHPAPPGVWADQRWLRTASPDADTRGVLSGLRVLDLTWVLAGPYATKILAEHGADVVKVESMKRADPTRFAPSMRLRPGTGHDDGGYFMNFNRNKRSIAVNMREELGRQLVRELAAECDVVIENFSAGVLDRWGLGYDRLRATNPDVILVSMSGTGQTGPWRNAVTFADTLAAMSGIAYETREPGGPPQGLSFGLGDMIAADAAVVAVLDLITAGRGGYVDLSQLEAMAAVTGTAALDRRLGATQASDVATARFPNRHPLRVPHGVYPTVGDDRWIAISVADDPAWSALCAAAGELERVCESSADAEQRRRREDEIDEWLTGWTAQQDGAGLASRLQRAGVSAAVVNHGQDLVDRDEQLRARCFYPTLEHPIAGTVRHEGIVVDLHRTPGSLHRAAPLLGEDTHEVLRELLGVSDERLATLQRAGVLR